jgi:hypothetical protein
MRAIARHCQDLACDLQHNLSLAGCALAVCYKDAWHSPLACSVEYVRTIKEHFIYTRCDIIRGPDPMAGRTSDIEAE